MKFVYTKDIFGNITCYNIYSEKKIERYTCDNCKLVDILCCPLLKDRKCV